MVGRAHHPGRFLSPTRGKQGFPQHFQGPGSMWPHRKKILTNQNAPFSHHPALGWVCSVALLPFPLHLYKQVPSLPFLRGVVPVPVAALEAVPFHALSVFCFAAVSRILPRSRASSSANPQNRRKGIYNFLSSSQVKSSTNTPILGQGWLM